MKKAIDIQEHEVLVPKHFQLTDTLWKILEEDAAKKTGGNVSWRLRQILRKEYKIEEKH